MRMKIRDLLTITPNGKSFKITCIVLHRDQYGRYIVDDGSGTIPIKNKNSMKLKSIYRIHGKLEKSKIGDKELVPNVVSNRDGLDFAMMIKIEKIRDKLSSN